MHKDKGRPLQGKGTPLVRLRWITEPGLAAPGDLGSVRADTP